MPCRRRHNNRGNIVAENKLLAVWTVESKNKLMLRMLNRDAFKGLVSETPDSIKTVF